MWTSTGGGTITWVIGQKKEWALQKCGLVQGNSTNTKQDYIWSAVQGRSDAPLL